jgi:hypothetical protein
MTELSPKFEGYITTKALRIDELNDLTLESFSDGDVKNALKYMDEFIDLKHEIQKSLYDISSAKIHNKKAREIIRKVKQKEDFEVDIFVKHIEQATGEKLLIDDVTELLSEDEIWLGSWVSTYEYIRGLGKIGSLIIGTTIPKRLERYVDEARNCFAYGQYLAVYSLSRTILETAVRDIGQKKKILPKNTDKVKRWELRKWGRIKDKVVPKYLRDEVKTIHGHTSGLIHGNKLIGEKEAIEIFMRTLTIVHKLYDHYKLY